MRQTSKKQHEPIAGDDGLGARTKMKWNLLERGSRARGFKALGVTLAVGLGMTACSRDYTVGYLYVTSATRSTSGLVNAYAIDFQSGAITPLADSPIPSGGNNPVGLVTAPNSKFVYVINQSAPSSNLVEFSIGSDGKLYPENTYPVVQSADKTVIGSFPTSIAIDPSGAFIYVTFTYQNGFSTTNPGPGGVAVFPVATDGSLGAPVVNTTVGTTAANPLPYFPVGNNPIGVAVRPLSNDFVYVVDQERPTNGAAFGVLLSFARDKTTGSLTPVTGTVANGVAAGTTPGGIAIDPGGHFLYVSDETTNQLYGYSLQANGSPLSMLSSPFNTGSFPLGVTVDPRGTFLYVANFGSSTVSSFAIDQGSGTLSGVSGTAGTQVATGPTCVAIDPALGIYLYTSNNQDNSVSAEQLNPHTGALTPVQGAKFSASALPTCAAAVANGAHATQIVN